MAHAADYYVEKLTDALALLGEEANKPETRDALFDAIDAIEEAMAQVEQALEADNQAA